MPWSIANKNELASALREFWPKEFETFKGEPHIHTLNAWRDELQKHEFQHVLAALTKLKLESNPEKAPKLEAVHATVRTWKHSQDSGGRPGTFPGECWGVKITGKTSRLHWIAASSGAYGPNREGFLTNSNGYPYFWPLVARKDFPNEALPEPAYQAILQKGRALRAAQEIPEEREPEFTAEEAAEMEPLWVGRIDHPNPKLRNAYKKMRIGMREGRMP